MRIDEYMASRGITPDDTVEVNDPCSVFDGNVVRNGKALRETQESERRLEKAESAIMDLLGD